MGDENIFDELEAFLDDIPSTVTNQSEPSAVTTPMTSSSNTGQTTNINQFSPSGQTPGSIRGPSGGSVSTGMMNNGYPSNGCSPTTKAVLGERLRNQLGGRGENCMSGELKRKMDDGLGGANDGTFNKAPKLEIKDEPSQQHGNGMFIKSDIKEESSGSQLEAILGLSSSTSDIKPKPDLNIISGGVMDVKQEYPQMANKPPPTQTGGILAKALMETRREPVSNNNMSMFNNNSGGNMRTTGMNSNGFGSRNIPDGNSMRSQMDPQSLKAVKKLQEVSKDPNLDHTTKQRKVFEIIKETPNVRQFLEWIEREKGKNAKGNQQRGTMGNMGSNDMGSLQSQGCPQGGGMIGNNCDPQAKTNSILPNNDPSMNGGGNIGSVHEFSPVPSGMQPGSPMSMNGSFGGSMMGQDMEKHRMQQWDMNQQQVGGVNQRPQHPGASPNVMIGPQGGNIPTTQFMHGSGMGARGMPPSNGVNGYGPGGPGMSNSPNMYHQPPNMIVGNNPGQNWSVMRQQPGMNKPSSIPPPNYPYRTPVNVRMGGRDNIRPGISPTIGGYLSNSPGQSNAFTNCGPTGPMRGSFPVGASMGDQYPIRNPNFPNTMYGGPNSAQNIQNGMPQMSVRMDVGFSNNPHGDGMSYQNGGHVGQSLGDNNYMNPIQPSRNGPTGAGGNMIVNPGMGSPMGNPSEFQRGMMHPNSPNLVRPPSHHMSPVAGGRTAIPHTSPMVQQHLISQGNVNGIPTNINPGSPAQRMMPVPNNGGMFSANNGLPPPNMTVPDADIQRFGHAAPPNYFNNENVGDGASGVNSVNNFNQMHQSGAHQSHQPQHRTQLNQQAGGPVQNSYSAGGTITDGSNRNFSMYSNPKGNGQSVNIGSNGQNLGCPAENSGDPNQQVNNGWKQNATELRKTLLTRLHHALLKQGDPNAQQNAETVESNAYMQSSSQEAYTMKLAQWLANTFSKQTEGSEGFGVNKNDENSSQQTADYPQQQFNSFDKQKEMNNMGNIQQNQQTCPSTNIPDLSSSSTTSTTVADSTTLKEALSKVGSTNPPNHENNNDENICSKTEVDLFSSSTMNDISNEASAEQGVENMGKSSAPKTNTILEELIQGDPDISSFDNTGTSKLTNSTDNEGSELLDDGYDKAPNMMISSIQENEPSVSTPNVIPQSNSSVYNMPSMSPNSSSTCTTPCSTSISSITTASSSQNSACTDVRTPSSSVQANPTSSTPSSKMCDSPSKLDDNSPGSMEHLSVTTSSSSQAFQPPANFPVSTIESNESGNKGTLQHQSQGPSVSSATTIAANNSCVTTLANKGSAMVTPVRRPSGKGINGQQSVNQPGPILNHGNSTVLSSLPGSINGQLSNGNACVAGQNNIQPHSVDSGIGSPRSIASQSTLYSPKIQGTSPSLNSISETLTSSASPPDKSSS